MKTIQGKEFNYSDVLLYKVRDNKDVVLFVDLDEQMKVFEKTNKLADAPVGIIPYSNETEIEILSHMKKIVTFNTTNIGKISVKYSDGNTVLFESSNEPIVKNNMESQRKYAKENYNSSKTKMTEEDKEKSIELYKQKLTKGLASSLADIALITGVIETNNRKEKTSDDESEIENTNTKKSNLSTEGKELFEEVNNKDTFVLKYQQVAEINWDEQLATEVVEIMNGLYPTTMNYMSSENAKTEMSEVLQTIELLIAGNINPETTKENIIDLSNYIINSKEKAIVNNAFLSVRNVVDELINESITGNLLLNDDESMKFNRQFINYVDELLNYEYSTINDNDYKSINAGVRFVVNTYFQSINDIIPQDSYIIGENNNIYYKYFFDEVDNRTYIPRKGINDNIEYYYDYYDKQNNCHEEVYSLDTMFAMAGIPVETDDRDLSITPNPNIHMLGIGLEVDNKVNEAIQELSNLKNTILVK